MKTNEYKRNVAMVIPARTTRSALRHLARNNARSGLLYSLLNLKTSMGSFVVVIQSYILGTAMTEKLKQEAFDSIGEVGRHMIATGKLLGSRLPSSTKKSRLKGMNRAKAILLMDAYTTEMLALKSRVFQENMDLPLPDVKNLPPDEQVQVLTHAKKANAEVLALREANLNDEIRDIFQKFVPLYWALVYDMFAVTPAEVFKADMDKVAESQPHGFFDPKPKAAPVH